MDSRFVRAGSSSRICALAGSGPNRIRVEVGRRPGVFDPLGSSVRGTAPSRHPCGRADSLEAGGATWFPAADATSVCLGDKLHALRTVSGASRGPRLGTDRARFSWWQVGNSNLFGPAHRLDSGGERGNPGRRKAAPAWREVRWTGPSRPSGSFQRSATGIVRDLGQVGAAVDRCVSPPRTGTSPRYAAGSIAGGRSGSRFYWDRGGLRVRGS